MDVFIISTMLIVFYIVGMCQSLRIVYFILYNFIFEIEPREFWMMLAFYH